MARASLSLLLLCAVCCILHAPVAKASLSVILNEGLTCEPEATIDVLISDAERADICKEACRKIDELVDPTKSDKKTESCRTAAKTIAKLFSYLPPLGSMPVGGLGEVQMQADIKKLMDHKDGCFLDLHTKWMWRDFICAIDTDTETGANEQKQSAARRFALDFLPYYHDTGDKDKKVFCFPTLLRILSDTATNLFQRDDCATVHPLWTKFADDTCSATCKASVLNALKLATKSEEGVEGGNAECCAALYYDHAFNFMFKSGQELELHDTFANDIGDGCDKDKLPCTKLESAVEKCIGKDDFKPFKMSKCHSGLH